MAHAVQLAPEAPEIMRMLGLYALWGYRDYARATAQFERVIRLQPNNSDAFANLGFVQRREGLWLESIGSLRMSIELDPGNATGRVLATTLMAGRRWEEALAEMRRGFALMTEVPLLLRSRLALHVFAATGSTHEADDLLARLAPAQLESPRILDMRKWRANVSGDYVEWKRLDGLQPYFDEDDTPRWLQAIDAAMIFAAHGDLVGARARLGNFPAEIRAALELEPANALKWGGLARMEALLGQKAQALRDAHKALELMPEALDTYIGPEHSRNLAVVLTWTGEKEQAIAELSRLLRVPAGTPGVYSLRVDAAFAPLRGDPRFEALLNDPKNNAPLF